MTGDGQAPPPLPYPPPTGDVMKSVIPTGNKPALIGYYCGVFSLIPVIGIPLGVGAVVLGLMGLRKVRAEPAARGTAHAWVAIVLGLVSTVGSALFFLWLMNLR